MTTIDLLDTVLPPGGWFAVVGIKGKVVRQTLVQTREEVNKLADELVREKFNVFFGCAKYKEDTNRTKDNVGFLKSFWLDIDCGIDKDEANKGYIDQATGMEELKRFCSVIGLPRPLIVNSGRGLHVYWALTEAISREQWEPVAARLHELCKTHKLYVDGAVFEAARILRIPGTFNFKAEPLLVEVMTDTVPMEFEELKNLLGVKELSSFPLQTFQAGELNELTTALLGNKVSRFKTIMMRGEDGCQQLNYAYSHQEEIPEPLWWSSLTVAHHCVDRAAAIHKMSDKHPDYSPEKTERKANQQKDGKSGPHSCATFEKHNPGGCAGCKWSGKIKSPIQLGREVVEAPAVEEEIAEAHAEMERIPTYPKPYLRGAAGGIYLPATGEEAEPICVYEHDLYVVKRMRDPVAGEVALLRLHLPHDGMKEFTAPLSAIAVKDELKKILAAQGVAGTPTQMGYLASYVLTFVKNLQYKKRAEVMRTQFGWAENNAKFIIGDREISKDGIYGSPPSSNTKEIAKHLVPIGTMEKWKEVFNMYRLPGLEPHAFAALTAFGAPLFRFTGLKGAIINVIYKLGGTGKSTTLFMCNSVYGHPEALASIWKDTNNAKMHRLGILNNLPYTVDEITNISPADFSDLAYGMSQGRSKDRMEGSSNKLRENDTTWQTMSLASANASFYEKLGSNKAGANAEMLRLFEYTIAPNNVISTEDGKRLFDRQLKENYGHAGDIYLQWLVNNLEEAVQAILNVQAKIDKELRLTPPERFWSAVAACNIAGGLIAKNLGLHDFNMKVIYEWTCKTIQGMREEIKPPADDVSSVIGDYINRHMQNILVVKANVDSRSAAAPLPTLEPKGELLIRYEPDTKMMYFVAREFKTDCVERQINYKDTLKELKEKGFFEGAMNKRMSKGMKITSPAVNALIFDCSTGFLDMDGLIAPEIENASGTPELQH
jgi:hypothetical protein